MTTLSKPQIINLLHNAYGFVDRYGELLLTDDALIHDDVFKLKRPDYDCLEFSYDNAKLINGTATFETPDGDVEYFTVVVVASDAFLGDCQSITEALFR